MIFTLEAGTKVPSARDTLPWTLYLRQLVTFFTIVDCAANFHAGISGSGASGLEAKLTVEVAKAALRKA